MKVLVVTTHFYPENFKANDMAFELSNRGHEVTVLTPIPDYPQGKFYKGYGVFKRRKEIVNGVEINRSLVIPRHNGSSKWLALNYLSYTFFSIFSAFWLGLKKKFDVVIVHEPSPVMVGIPAIIVKKIQKIPLHFWVLDLWPESLSAAGGIKKNQILSIFERLTKWIYKNSDTLLIGSKGYRKSIISKGDFDDKIKYFPNWVENSLLQNNYDINSNDLSLPELPVGFNVVIAGNMGDAQDLPHIMDAAKKVKGKNINFIFIGDGRRKEFVEKYVEDNGLDKQVYCLGRFPLETMPFFFEKADILFFALKNTPIFSLTVPSRLQAYMSAGKPVVAMINGEGADLIKEADCGWSVTAEDSEALAVLLTKLSAESPDILKEKGANGKRYSEKHFGFQNCIDHLEQIIKSKSYKSLYK